MARTLDRRPLPRRSTAAPRACRGRARREEGGPQGGQLPATVLSRSNRLGPGVAAGCCTPARPSCGPGNPPQPKHTRMRVSTTESTPAPAAASAALRQAHSRLAAGASSFGQPPTAAARRFWPAAGPGGSHAAAAPAPAAAAAGGAGRASAAAGVGGGAGRLTARVSSGAARCGSPRASHSSVQPCRGAGQTSAALQCTAAVHAAPPACTARPRPSPHLHREAAPGVRHARAGGGAQGQVGEAARGPAGGGVGAGPAASRGMHGSAWRKAAVAGNGCCQDTPKADTKTQSPAFLRQKASCHPAHSA